MERSAQNSQAGIEEPPPEVAKILAKAAARSERAMLVGNRAGVVEWANPAWSRLTAFPLAEIVSKPISRFLERTNVELELVDFVAQNFLDGRASTMEFPFDTPDGRSIWVHLEVQPIRGADGEVTDFVASISDISARRRNESERGDRRSGPDGGAPTRRYVRSPLANGFEDDRSLNRVSLSDEAASVCDRFERVGTGRTTFDFDLDPDLPSIRSDPSLLREIIRLLVRAAALDTDDSWGFVTVLTGRTAAGRSHVSAAHPVVLRAPELAEGPFLYLEVHDTGPTFGPADLECVRSGAPHADPRVDALATASTLARVLGGSLLVDSTPGCGTQALLLLPIEENETRPPLVRTIRPGAERQAVCGTIRPGAAR